MQTVSSESESWVRDSCLVEFLYWYSSKKNYRESVSLKSRFLDLVFSPIEGFIGCIGVKGNELLWYETFHHF